MKIEKLLSSLIRKHNTNNPFKLASLLDIIVVKMPLNKNLIGFYQYFKRNKIVYININFCENIQLLACACGLGHALLHTKHKIIFFESNLLNLNHDFEIQAYKFALELLTANDIIIQGKHIFMNEFHLNKEDLLGLLISNI